MEYKCRNCGGELHFDPTIGKLKCPFCGSTYELSEYEEVRIPDVPDQQPEHSAHRHQHVHAMDDTTEIQEDLRAFSCPHCGAEIITDKDTVSTQCIFCHTPMVIEEQVEGKFRPAKVIPFEVDQKQIETIYEQYIRNKPFYPEEYSKANVIEKIKSIYLPFWLFDMNLGGEANATGERTVTFTSGNYIVTNHDVFALHREGEMGFEKIPVIASSKTPKDAMDSIEPFDYSRLTDYNPGYLPGFLAQRYDLDDQKTIEFSKNRAQQSFQNAMLETMGGYEGVRLTGMNSMASQVHADYVLLPSYLLFMDYDRDEDKLIAINGQTGKIVGNIPVDRNKRNRFFISRFLLLLLIFMLISFGGLMLLG